MTDVMPGCATIPGVRPGSLPRLDVPSAAAWRAWLEQHHGSSSGVWLVFHKGQSRPHGPSYQDALDEALCFGWIDSVVKRQDDRRYLRKFTPRTNRKNWSELNKRHARRLIQEGRMREAGRRAIGVPLRSTDPRAAGRGASPPPKRRLARQLEHGDPGPEVPDFITAAIRTRPAAAALFAGLAPSYRRRYVGWITSARQDATRARRLAEVVELLEKGVKSVLK